MIYKKRIWKDGDLISMGALNRMEDELEKNSIKINDLKETLSKQEEMMEEKVQECEQLLEKCVKVAQMCSEILKGGV